MPVIALSHALVSRSARAYDELALCVSRRRASHSQIEVIVIIIQRGLLAVVLRGAIHERPLVSSCAPLSTPSSLRQLTVILGPLPPLPSPLSTCSNRSTNCASFTLDRIWPDWAIWMMRLVMPWAFCGLTREMRETGGWAGEQGRGVREV